MLKEKISDYISQYPEGVNISTLEKTFGESRMRLGYIINKLLEEGKIQKTHYTYIPLQNSKLLKKT